MGLVQYLLHGLAPSTVPEWSHPPAYVAAVGIKKRLSSTMEVL